MPLSIFLPKNSSFCYWNEEDQIKNWGDSDETGCVYIEGELEPTFRPSLTWRRRTFSNTPGRFYLPV
jgi:hypothetical protein